MYMYFHTDLECLKDVRIHRLPYVINAQKVARLTGGRWLLILGKNGKLYSDLPRRGQFERLPVTQARVFTTALNALGVINADEAQEIHNAASRDRVTRNKRDAASMLVHNAERAGVKLTKAQLAKIAKLESV